MRNRAEPVAPPAGYKWVVSRSVMTHYRYQLGLFPVDAEVDDTGTYYREHPGDQNFKKGAPIPQHSKHVEYFNRPTQLHRASRRILDVVARETYDRLRFRTVREMVGG